MTINLRTNYSEPNRIHKNSTYINEYRECVLKAGTSIVNPTFLIKADYAAIKKCNYIYVAEFERYYFVNEIVAVRNGLFEFRCTCDVISTFWNEYKINDAVIRRNEHKFNTLINDGTVMNYQNPYVTAYNFNNVFSDDEMSYLLLVAGGAQ